MRIRRGLYAVIPPGVEPDKLPIDQYLVASKMSSDAVLGYHIALEFFGKAYSAYSHTYFFSCSSVRNSRIRSKLYVGVSHPKSLRDKGKELVEVLTRERQGVPLKVTSLERTFIDIFDRPDLGGGWEEVWRSIETVEYL